MFTHLSLLLVAKRTGILRYHFWYKLLMYKINKLKGYIIQHREYD